MEKKQKKEYIQIIILSVLIVLLVISMIFTSSISNGIKHLLFKADVRVEDGLVVHFIDVGQGDAIAIKFPNEEVMLIDSGPKIAQNYFIEYIKSDVLASDKNLTIDYIILTHPDIDHSGGMCAVFGEFDVERFFRPNIASESENSRDFATTSTLNEYDELINSAKQEEGLQVSIINQNYEFYIGDAFIQIFAPLKAYDTNNEMSAIIKVSYMGKSFLFTGDISGEGEDDMVKTYGNQLNADVLKVAHHGSNTSTSVEFIETVTPTYAIICVGKNSYGHPHFDTIANLHNRGVEILTIKEESVRIVCGQDILGVLDKDITHSYEFVDWWIVALVIDLILVVILFKIILKLIKTSKYNNENKN